MIIDTHTHALAGWKAETVKKHFAFTGVDKIVLSALPLDHWKFIERNEGCARFLKRFPNKAVGLIGIYPPNVDQSLRDIEKYHKQGFVGIKIMPTAGFNPGDERFRRVFEEVNARKMIVMSHCGWTSPDKERKEPDLPQSTLFSHPYNFEPLIRLFPDTDFIFAHAGGRTMFPAAFELVHYHQNAWIDTCPGNGTWVLQHGGIWLNLLNWDRVLFGSDSVYGYGSLSSGSLASFKDTVAFVKHTLYQAGFQDKLEAVMGGNAKRLLKKHRVKI